MNRSAQSRKVTLRRLATTIAAIGALFMSSGIALIVTAAPANAATKVGICHATSSDTNPYEFIEVDANSVKFKGHLEHRENPNKTWKNDGTFNGKAHVAGQDKPDLIGSYTDENGVFRVMDGVITAADCAPAVPVLESTADVDFLDASCAFPTRAEYETFGSNVAFTVKSGSAAVGQSIVVLATSTNGAKFDNGDTEREFPHTFAAAVDPTQPPCVVLPPDPDPVKVNVCHATSSDTNPYEFIEVNNDAVKLQGHLDHRANPVHTWKDAGTFNGVPHAAGDPKPDLIGDFIDDQGDLQVYDGVITEALCLGAVVPPTPVATADVVFLDPTCVDPTRADYTTSGTNVAFSIKSGSKAPGASIVVLATATGGAEFAGGDTEKEFPHTFGAAIDPTVPPCTIVDPPDPVRDATANVIFVDPSCVNFSIFAFLPFGQFVTFAVTDGILLPGQSIEITATAVPGHEFEDGTTTKVFTHTFGPLVDLFGPPCVIVDPPDDADATASVDFVDPSCANLNTPSYATNGNEATFAITDGEVAPGSAVEVTATANPGHTFADLSTEQVFTHQFGAAVDLEGEPCVVVEPPVVNPPVVNPPIVDPPFITPTVVQSGLVSADDLRSEQGLALLVSGMVLLMLAGGLGLAPGRVRS